MRATGSVLTNKYAEGYPGKRYYGGNAIVDDVEALAIDRAKELFGAEHANVQPHSGASANMARVPRSARCRATRSWASASITAATSPTARRSTRSGIFYNFVSYKVDPSDERIDYDADARAGPRAPPEDDRRRHDELPAPARPRGCSAASPTKSARC